MIGKFNLREIHGKFETFVIIRLSTVCFALKLTHTSQFVQHTILLMNHITHCPFATKLKSPNFLFALSDHDQK